MAAEETAGFDVFVAGFEAEDGCHAEGAVGARGEDHLENDDQDGKGEEGKSIECDPLIRGYQGVDQSAQSGGDQYAPGADQ